MAAIRAGHPDRPRSCRPRRRPPLHPPMRPACRSPGELSHGPGDLRRVLSGPFAVPIEHVELAPHLRRVAVHVARVPEARSQVQRALRRPGHEHWDEAAHRPGEL